MANLKKVKKLLKDKQEELFDRSKYVSKEFQDYGYRLAVKLNDLKHKSLYIKLAKEEKRAFLDNALSFTLDYPNARDKAKIFMWKLKELKEEYKKKKDKNGDKTPKNEKGDK